MPVSTGVDELDALLDGGLEPGELAVAVARPGGPVERLLYAAAARSPTRYLSTLRPAAAVESVLGRHAATATTTVEAVSGDDLVTAPEETLSGLEPESLVVVDPITEVEQASREAYRSFLDATRRVLRMTESVAIVGAPETRPRTLRRDLTLARADHVWRLAVDPRDGVVEPRLTVSRARGRALPSRQLEIAFGRGETTATRLGP